MIVWMSKSDYRVTTIVGFANQEFEYINIEANYKKQKTWKEIVHWIRRITQGPEKGGERNKTTKEI